MAANNTRADTLILFGSGFSVNLGLPTTAEINDAISILLDLDNEEYAEKPSSINERLKRIASKVLVNKIPLDQFAKEDFYNTLSLLFDGDGAKKEGEALEKRDKAWDNYVAQYRKYFPDANIDKVQRNVMFNVSAYDFIGFKSIGLSMKESVPKKSVEIVNLLSTIQNAISNNISIPTTEIFPAEKTITKSVYYCDRERLDGALKLYKLLVFKLFKHLIRINSRDKLLSQYEDFLYRLIKDHADIDLLKLDKRAENDPRSSNNYLSPIAFLPYNWDPIVPFFTMKQNWKINAELLKSSGNGVCNKIYADFGVPMPRIRLTDPKMDDIDFALSEDVAVMINGFTYDSYYKNTYGDVKSKLLIKIIKLFIPHGLFNLRICPRCQNVFIIFSESFGNIQLSNIHDLFVSDPLPSGYDLAFLSKYKKYPKIIEAYNNGTPDELDCPICKHPTSFEDTFMEIQSLFKTEKPGMINKIHYDAAENFSKAKHIISIGYAFPHDDISNSILYRTMRIRKEKAGFPKLTYIGYSSLNSLRDKTWYKLKEVEERNASSQDAYLSKTLDEIKSIFKDDDIRLSFLGFPDILEKVSVKEMLKWQ